MWRALVAQKRGWLRNTQEGFEYHNLGGGGGALPFPAGPGFRQRPPPGPKEAGGRKKRKGGKTTPEGGGGGARLHFSTGSGFRQRHAPKIEIYLLSRTKVSMS